MNSAATPFFFIIGRPRSGTTLIRMMFDAHPNVNIPIESPFIVSMYGKFGKVKHWDEAKILSFYHHLFDFNHFDEWTIDREELKNKLLELQGEHAFNELINVVYASYKSLYPKHEILLQGDKNPYFTLYIRRLAKIYPEAKFLFIYRDYRDHFYSMSRVNFEADIPALIGWRWKYYVRDVERFVKKHPQRSLLFRYEDFVNEPEKHLMEFSAFLDIPYVGSVLGYHDHVEQAKKFHSEEMEKYHQSLMKPVNKSRMGLWKEKLSDEQIRTLDYVVGKYARVAGYEKKYKKSNLKTIIRALPVIIYGNLMYAAIKAGDILPYNLKMWLLARLNFFLEFYQNRKNKNAGIR